MKTSGIINEVGGVISVYHKGDFNFLFTNGKYTLKTVGIRHAIRIIKAIKGTT